MVRLGFVRLGLVWFGSVRFGYISFLYFITQKLSTLAAVPVSTAFFEYWIEKEVGFLALLTC